MITEIKLQKAEDLRIIWSAITTATPDSKRKEKAITFHTVKDGMDLIDDVGEYRFAYKYDKLYIQVDGIDTVIFSYSD